MSTAVHVAMLGRRAYKFWGFSLISRQRWGKLGTVYIFRGGVGFGLGNISICEDPAEHHEAEQICEKKK